MNFLKSFICITLIFLCGCTTVKVVNINESDNLKKNALVYCLPRNIIRINIEVTKTTYKPGPYYEYAEKYLGIKEVIKTGKKVFRITNIDIKTYAEPDSSLYYLIFSKGKNIAELLTLTEEGMLLAVNSDIDNNKYQPVVNLNELSRGEKQIKYTDLSVKRNFREESSTMTKRVKKDTSYIKIPVQKTSIIKKSIQEKAEEAANFMIKLRKRRFKLIAGIYEKFPESEALNTMICELDSLENEYLSLFTGKTITEVMNYSYDHVPGQNNSPVSLCYFSEENGISADNTNKGKPVLIEVINECKTDSLHAYQDRLMSNKKGNNGIFYRIPDHAIINIFAGNSIIASSRLLIAQYGSVVSLPACILKKRSVEFYPEYGSIRKISIKE